jgi:transposase InsO family protein
MAEQKLHGLPSRRRRKYLPGPATSDDLVRRDFARHAANQLWVTDITEHPTREGLIFCCVVLDAHSRKVVGWSIDTQETTTLVTNALSMAVGCRKPSQTIVHADHGSQFTSWAFTERVRQAGLMISMGTVGDALDNALMESFWARVQVELFNRRKWKTRVELANALFEYLEVFHNRNRRHSALGMLTPVEYEKLSEGVTTVA